jgi:hypothetical protein
LAAFNGPLQAWSSHWAASTDGFRLFNLCYRWTRIADGEEEFWIFIPTSGLVSPIHRISTYSSGQGSIVNQGLPMSNGSAHFLGDFSGDSALLISESGLK